MVGLDPGCPAKKAGICKVIIVAWAWTRGDWDKIVAYGRLQRSPYRHLAVNYRNRNHSYMKFLGYGVAPVCSI